MSLAHGTSIVRSGLVRYWDAANVKSYTESGSTCTNLTGESGDLTLINGVSYNSENLGGLIFDGVNDRGTFVSPITAASPQTYEVWVKADRSNGAQGFGYVLHNNNASSNLGTSYMAITYNGDAGYPLGQIHAGFNGDWGNMGTGVLGSLITPRHIVLTWNGANQSVYVDGVIRNSRPLTGTPFNFSTVTSVGDWRASTYRPIVGSLYSIKVYNRALTEAEVQQNFEAVRRRFGV